MILLIHNSVLNSTLPTLIGEIVMKEKIKQIVENCLLQLKETSGLSFEITDGIVLLGENAVLDSFDFVSLTQEIEDKVSDELGKDITIVSAKAFSKKNSPFKNVDTLSEYILELVSND